MLKEIKKEPEKNLDNTGQIKPKRDKKGRLLPGYTANPKGKPKGAVSLLAILKKMLEEMIEEKTSKKKKQKARALMEIYLKKAIVEEDKDVIKDIINRIDGMPKQNLELGVDEKIGEVNITINKKNKNEDSESPINDSISENLGGISEEAAQNNNTGGRNGEQQNDVSGPTDGNDNAEGKEKADNDSKKDPAGSEGDSDAGLPECAEGNGSV